MVYADFAQGFRDGGTNSRLSRSRATTTACRRSTCPTRSTISSSAGKPRSLNGRLVWNGAAYLMDWKQLQTHHLRCGHLRAEQLQRQRRQRAHLRRGIERRLQDQRELVVAGCRQLHRFAHRLRPIRHLPSRTSASACPTCRISAGAGTCATSTRSTQSLRGYAQFDMAHKGDMWDDLHVAGSNGFPRILQPEYSALPICASG